MAEKRHIDEIIKEKLQNFEYEPSGALWERIESTLQPEPSTSEKPTTSTKSQIYSYMAAFLFFATFFVIYLQKDTTEHAGVQYLTAVDFNLNNRPVYNSNSDQTTLNTKRNTGSEKSILNNTILTEPDENALVNVVSNSNVQEPVQSETASALQLQNTENISLSASESITDNTIRQLKNIATTTKPIAINSTIPVSDEQNIRSLALSPIVEKTSKYFYDVNYTNEGVTQIYYKDLESYNSQIRLKGMSFGVAASYNQTSVLENGNIFKEEKPIQSALKFGASKGVSLGYNFSNKFGMQVDYIYNSVQGQNYVLSEENQLVQKTLALYYNQLPVTFKLKVPRISDLTQKPVVVNYIAGLQYGKLTEYHIPQEKLYTGNEELFKQTEISFLLGIDYDVFLSKRSFVTVGARTSISNDISTHEYPLDDYAKRNFVFGLRASLNYMFRDY